MSRPLLSLCLVAKNEEYQGDYLYRLRTCLDFLGKGLASLGRVRDVEILVTDWGSDVPLHEDLSLPPEAHDLVRFIRVPPELACQRQRDSSFSYTIACNTAVRRAEGKFIFDLAPDIILTEPVIHALTSLLDGRYPNIPLRIALFELPRRHLPACQVLRSPSHRDLTEYLARNLSAVPIDPTNRGYGGASGVLAHRSLWEATRGYDESMVYGGWSDVDFALRMSQRYPILDLATFGVSSVHLSHHGFGGHAPVGRWKNTRNDNPPFAANEEDWGMASEHLEIHTLKKLASVAPPDETDRVGTVESWNVTAEEIAKGLNDPALAKQVQEVLGSVRFAEGHHFDPSLDEMSSFAALTWNARRRGVRTYVETGVKVPYGACLVTRNSPGVEVYCVVDWDHAQGRGNFQRVSNSLLRQLGQHWGYVRFVGGDPATAIHRLSKSVAGRFAVDLAMVRCGPTLPAAPQQAVELAGYLTPGGAIVVCGVDEASFRQVWSSLLAQRPSLTYLRFADGRSGMVLAAVLSP